ncbi:hypothetical protein NDU88_001280 [Pleurodeles waltl]|uniref:Uncharacterized protein n=1 Tax=Pleurodeles waltl TaxID=8319 RepID=A0AAV7KP22_PLEWA|nr:hypothetical protein NDU88_001280 [Pleurodeles waltl]
MCCGYFTCALRAEVPRPHQHPVVDDASISPGGSGSFRLASTPSEGEAREQWRLLQGQRPGLLPKAHAHAQTHLAAFARIDHFTRQGERAGASLTGLEEATFRSTALLAARMDGTARPDRPSSRTCYSANMDGRPPAHV